MQLRELLNIIDNLARKYQINKPYLCGGVPRDKLLGNLSQINDLDLTTGDDSSKKLAEVVAKELSSFHPKIQKMSDGHIKIIIGNLQLDFSSHFIVPGIEPLLKLQGVARATPLDLEMFSRDFTCNSLLISLDLQELKDVTKRGLISLKEKKLYTCLNPELTLGKDPKRIVRAIYLGAKLNFDLDQEIINWIKKNGKLAATEVDTGYTTRKLKKALQYNTNKTIELLKLTNLWSIYAVLPILEPWRRYG